MSEGSRSAASANTSWAVAHSWGAGVGVGPPAEDDEQQPASVRALGPDGAVKEGVDEGVPVAAEPVGQAERAGAAVHQARLVGHPVEVEGDHERAGGVAGGVVGHPGTAVNDA